MNITAKAIAHRPGQGAATIVTVAVEYPGVLPAQNFEYTFATGAELDPANVAQRILSEATRYETLVDAALALKQSAGASLVAGNPSVVLVDVAPGYEGAVVTLDITYQGVTTRKTPLYTDPAQLTLDAMTAQAVGIANALTFDSRLAVLDQMIAGNVDIVAWALQQAGGQ